MALLNLPQQKSQVPAIFGCGIFQTCFLYIPKYFQESKLFILYNPENYVKCMDDVVTTHKSPNVSLQQHSNPATGFYYQCPWQTKINVSPSLISYF